MEFALVKGVSKDGLRTEWIKLKTLGRGSYGVVYLAKPTNPDSDQLFAVKASPCQDSFALQKELEILEECVGCENIAQCYGELAVSIHKENLVYNLFLEYASGGSLLDLIEKYGGKIPEPDARCYTRMLVEGLRCVHQRGFVHCDLKPENILVYPSHPFGSISTLKIADFGMARKLGETVYVPKKKPWEPTFPGTPVYMPPESVDAEEVTAALDIWSLGCVVLEMVTGKQPWKYWKLMDMTVQLLSSGNSPKVPESMSREGKDFLMRCFARDPDDRWTADMLLCHPFLLPECSISWPSPTDSLHQALADSYFSSVEEPQTMLLFV